MSCGEPLEYDDDHRVPRWSEFVVVRFGGWLRRLFSGSSGTPRRASRIPFKLKYGYFRELLQANDGVLEFIAELEDALSGGHAIGSDELRSRLEEATLATFVMVKNLNLISGGRYAALYPVLNRINAVLLGELGARRTTRPAELVVSLDAALRDAEDALGGKMANLGEVRNRTGLRVPDGFVITTSAFDALLEHDGLAEHIGSCLALAPTDPAELAEASSSAQRLVLGASLPAPLRAAIEQATAALCARAGRSLRLAVRSSALGEDSQQLSFAGQYETVLNVEPRDVPDCYLRVVASLYSAGAIAYRRDRGIREDETRMAVGVMELVEAECAGVMFSRDPGRPTEPRVLVDAVPGQGVGAVAGTVAPDVFVISGEPPQIVERTIAQKRRIQVAAPAGGLSDIELADDRRRRACIDDQHLLELARVARKLEAHFGMPQDIEWALDEAGKLHVLQSRPLGMETARATRDSWRPVEGREVLLKEGMCACPGIGAGMVVRVETEADLERVHVGSVLVAHHSSPTFVRVMRRVHAIVTEVGGATGHMAILSREFGVPAIVGAPGAERLVSGTMVTVDADHTVIYAGRVAALLESAQRGGLPIRRPQGSVEIERLAAYLCPLHLVDPASPAFRPEECRSIHDVTRFVHEKTFAEMFHLGDDVKSSDEASALKLVAHLPIDVYVFDLGGALQAGAGAGGKVALDDLASVPLRAFVDGLNDPAIRWDRPRPVSIGGFLSVLGESMVGPPPSKHGLGRRSFAMASDTYLNFATRAGYHFSTVDAYCGRSINKNYVQLRFGGGAAAEERRVRRVRFVAGVMRRLGFTVQTRADLVVARLHKYPREDIATVLRTLGRLTVCCRQLDMLMDSDAVVQHFVEAFFAADYEVFA
jgi:pyruvate,water dikinase